MRKKLWKSLLAAGTALMMSIGAASLVQAEPRQLITAPEEMSAEYFKTLQGNGAPLTGKASLTIGKYINKADNSEEADTSKPIGGIEFQYGKIGNLYEIQDGDATVMAYGIQNKVATAAGIQNSADYTHGEMCFYKDGSVINQAVQEQDKKKFLDLSLDLKKATTGENGQISAELAAPNPYGLYLVMETDVSGAYVMKEGKPVPVSITGSRNPFVISIPTYITDGTGYWEEQITANVKNSTDDAEVEKKIVIGDNEALTDGKESVADTDTTSIGDTVHFRLKGTVPFIPKNGNDITKYVLTDNISKGLTPVVVEGEGTEKGTVKIDGVRTAGGNQAPQLQLGSDYTVSALSSDNEEEKAPKYKSGSTFTITFTEEGLRKLSDWAKDGGTAKREIYFYYSAVVNENAVVGPKAEGAAENSGNPNEVKLTYQIAGNQEMNTSYDKVTEFTFGIDVTKQLNGGKETITEENRKEIQFILYSGKTDAETYYQLKETSEGSGIYKMTNVPATKDTATKMSPAAGGKMEIRGLEEGTYYLKEIVTIKGYNLLKKPVEIVITGKKGLNNYVADAVNTGNSEYTGALDKKDNTDGKVNLSVNNTSGFQLPATGGRGAGIFAVCGVLVIGAGIVYYVAARKKERKAK